MKQIIWKLVFAGFAPGNQRIWNSNILIRKTNKNVHIRAGITLYIDQSPWLPGTSFNSKIEIQYRRICIRYNYYARKYSYCLACQYVSNFSNFVFFLFKYAFYHIFTCHLGRKRCIELSNCLKNHTMFTTVDSVFECQTPLLLYMTRLLAIKPSYMSQTVES